jgi:Phage integrase, N-terminal SAM-like domain
VRQALAPPTINELRVQASDTDWQLVSLWLHDRSRITRRAYRADVARFLAFVAKPLPTVTLGDLQAFADTLEDEDLAPGSPARTWPPSSRCSPSASAPATCT